MKAIKLNQAHRRPANLKINLILCVLTLLVLPIFIINSGCLWTIDSQEYRAMAGSSAGGLTAANPYPANGTTEVPDNTTLSWASVSGMTGYDVYLGAGPNEMCLMTSVCNTAYRIKYTPPVLAGNTLYYWRVDCKNAFGAYIGPVWTFTTKNSACYLTDPDPVSGAINVITTAAFSWNAQSAQGIASYDVYFGICLNPPFKQNQTGRTYHPGVLSCNSLYYWKISARNSSGQILGTGPVWSFRTNISLNRADCPNPFNGAVDCSINTHLSWASIAGATKYDVYFSAEGGSGSGRGVTIPLIKVATDLPKTLNRTKYNPGPLAYGTTYYWYINAKNDVGGEMVGIVWNFTTKPDMPGTLTALYPAYGISVVPIRNAVLFWTSAARADSYDVYFSSESAPAVPGQETISLPYRANTASTCYYPGALVYNTAYCWKINPRNVSGVRTDTPIWHFRTVRQNPPAQASGPYPVSGTPNCAITTQLSWLSGNDADTYDLYFGTTPEPPQVLTNTPKGVYRTRYHPALTYSTTYYWRVDARNFNNAAPTAGLVWKFSTMGPYPSQAGNPNPLNGQANCPSNQILSWNASTLATSYDIYFGTVVTLTGIHFKKNTANLNYTPGSLQYSTTYNWRIDARNNNGVTAGQTWHFITLAPPDRASALFPAHQSKNILTNITLTWKPAARASSYNVLLGKTNPPLLVTNTVLTNYTVSNLTPGTLYYWQIDAMNAAGTAPGETWNFTTMHLPQPVPALTYPDEGATGLPVNLTLSWTKAEHASSYDVYISKDYPPSGTGTNPINITGLTCELFGLTGGQTYYWTVYSKNAIAEAPPGFPYRSFSTAPPPGKPFLQLPPDNEFNCSIDQTISWLPADRAESYNIYFSRAAAPLERIDNVDNTVLSYRPAEKVVIKDGVKYCWQIEAAGIGGDIKSDDIRNFTTALNPPELFNCTVNSPTRITLAWIDNSESEQFYYIDRKAGDDEWGIEYALTGPGVNTGHTKTLIEAGLSEGTEYFYRVYAFNSEAGKSAYIEASVITPLKKRMDLMQRLFHPAKFASAGTLIKKQTDIR